MLLNACVPGATLTFPNPILQDPAIMRNTDETEMLPETNPEGCSPGEAAKILSDFFDALNGGNQQEIMPFIGDDFKWFSFTQEEVPNDENGRHVAFISYGANLLVEPSRDIFYGPREETISRMLDYFMQRHTQNQTLQLRELSVTGGSATSMDIAYTLSHYADDLDANVWGPYYLAEGKGNIDCVNRKINVWSVVMATYPSNSFLKIPFTNKFISGTCPLTLSTFRAIASSLLSGDVIVCVR